MIIRHIAGANVMLAKDQPEYLTVPCLVQEIDGVRHWSSAHEPTPEELARLNAGAPLILTLLTTFHPPCRLEVGEVPA